MEKTTTVFIADSAEDFTSGLSAALQRSVSILPNGKQLHISISGGIAWYPTDGHDLLTLKKYADFALYQVKHSHKGCLQEFSMDSRADTPPKDAP